MKNLGKVNLSTIVVVFVAGMLWKITLPAVLMSVVGLFVLEKLKIKV